MPRPPPLPPQLYQAFRSELPSYDGPACEEVTQILLDICETHGRRVNTTLHYELGEDEVKQHALDAIVTTLEACAAGNFEGTSAGELVKFAKRVVFNTLNSTVKSRVRRRAVQHRLEHVPPPEHSYGEMPLTIEDLVRQGVDPKDLDQISEVLRADSCAQLARDQHVSRSTVTRQTRKAVERISSALGVPSRDVVRMLDARVLQGWIESW